VARRDGLARLSGQVAVEADCLGEGTIVAVVAEAGREIGIECGGLVTEYHGRKKGRRPDKPGQCRYGPAVLDGKLVTSGQLESSIAVHLGVGPAYPRLFPARWNPLLRAERRFPPVQDGGQALRAAGDRQLPTGTVVQRRPATARWRGIGRYGWGRAREPALH
jgi:hypothetical protein